MDSNGSASISKPLNQSQLSSVSKKHGKLITFLRTFMKSRPTKQKLKQRGILKERVFGCDLGEHLLNSGHDGKERSEQCLLCTLRLYKPAQKPLRKETQTVLFSDLIYSPPPPFLFFPPFRHEFDSEQIPDLTKDVYIQDIHCVGSLCKLYFRELPNPLLTYQLYEKFSDAVSAATDEERLVKIHDVIQQLPPPHYRTLEFLMRHLSHLAEYCAITNMHTKNLAIVWAPNLLRKRPPSKMKKSPVGSWRSFFNLGKSSSLSKRKLQRNPSEPSEMKAIALAAQLPLRVVSACLTQLLDLLINCLQNVKKSAKYGGVSPESLLSQALLIHTVLPLALPSVSVAGHSSLSRPKSLLVSSPSTKLLTLEEAQARTQAQINSPALTDSKYIEVGEGPAALQGKFHTIIDFPSERSKQIESACFSGTAAFMEVRIQSVVVEFILNHVDVLFSSKLSSVIRESAVLPGESKLFRPRRPRSSSDALSVSFNGELLGNMNRCNSYDNLPQDQESDGDEGHLQVPALISPRSAEDVDLSPPEIGVASLDFDPMSFQCSPPKAESECLDSSTSLLESVDYNKDKPSLFKKELDSGSQSHTPCSATSSEPVSPYQEKNPSPFFTLDLRPSEERPSKHLSFSEKLTCAYSPKSGQKPVKSPPLAGSEPVPYSAPSRMPDVVTGGASESIGPLDWAKKTGDGNEASSMSLSQLMVSPLRSNESRHGEEHQQELQNAGDTKKAELQEEVDPLTLSSGQSKPVPSGLTQPGAVALATPQDSAPVNSVSVVPPPPPKNAARILALALAESAQQASVQSQKKPDIYSDCNNCGKSESAGSLEKFHPYPGSASERLQFYAPLPENPLSFQVVGDLQRSGLPSVQGPQISGVSEGDNHLHVVTSEHRDHATFSNNMAGDLHGGTNMVWDHSHFYPCTVGETHLLTQSFASEDQSHLHSCPGRAVQAEPPTAEIPPESPPLHAGVPLDKNPIQATKIHLPLCKVEDRLLPFPPVPPGEKNVPDDLACVIKNYPAAAKPNPGMSRQNIPPQPSTVTSNISWGEAALPAGSHQVLPVRPGDQPAVGQTPPKKPSGGFSQVQGEATPDKLLEPRTAESAPVVGAEASATIQCTSATPVALFHQGHLEKPRENTRAPPLQMRSESVPAQSSYAFMPPVPPVRTMESKLAAAMHSNSTDTINPAHFHAFMASSSLPLSAEDVLATSTLSKQTSLPSAYFLPSKSESTPEAPAHPKPSSAHQYRAENSQPHLFHSKSEQHPGYPSLSEAPPSLGSRYNAYASQGKSPYVHYAKPRSRIEYLSSLSPTMSSSCAEEAPPYPTIRRVHSLHVSTPSAIRSVPISRTEVPPDDDPLYCPRPLLQYKPYQPHGDYHVTQLQPYFENGRVHYRYSPYSSSSSVSCYTAGEGGFYDLDPYGTVRLRQFHPLPGKDFPSYSKLPTKNLYRCPGLPSYPRGGLPGHLAGKEHSFISRDVPPAPDVKPMYVSWDLEDMEKYCMQSIRRESRARQKVKGPVMSQYDNVAPLLQEEARATDIVHLRSKSDPGKTGLLTVADGKEGRYLSKGGAPEGEEHYYGPQPEPDVDRAHYRGGYGNGQSEKPLLPQKQSSLRSRKPPEAGCNSIEHRMHLAHEAAHRQPPDAKNAPSYADYRPKGHPSEPTETLIYQHSGGKYIPANHDVLRLNHKEAKLAEDGERARSRHPAAPAEKHSRDCYKESEHYGQPPGPPPKPERSHSLRFQHSESTQRDASLLYPYQTLGKRQSTTVVSQYDNLDDYRTMPQHQRGGYSGGGGGVAPSFPHPHSRTYATALGQGAFLPSDLCLQRPETEVHAE
ncbi:PREDICTED: rho GTPase-activating protein 32 [Thamnophis sirtalis]|uniref:Rho GTPase-activating protein 32 n=1 Tax=Thamnophis sirtalis TaxID=35019 RepID=A0A6I9XY68_9SAUR|nr:PREDICTED: rho GTPase-activating protein 32 [Thamnophis sirtalis]